MTTNQNPQSETTPQGIIVMRWILTMLSLLLFICLISTVIREVKFSKRLFANSINERIVVYKNDITNTYLCSSHKLEYPYRRLTIYVNENNYIVIENIDGIEVKILRED